MYKFIHLLLLGKRVHYTTVFMFMLTDFLLLFFSNQYKIIEATGETGDSLISNGIGCRARETGSRFVSQRFEELVINILVH